jgi:hypothetical protein
MTYVQMNSGDPTQTQEAINKAKRISEGKGFVGWLTKLFMGKNFTNQMQHGLNTAQQAIDNAQMQQQLMQYGTSATAQVLSLQDTGSFVNMQPVVIVRLRVMTPYRTTYDQAIQTPLSQVNMPRPGDIVNIKYNPSNPSQIVILGVAQPGQPQQGQWAQQPGQPQQGQWAQQPGQPQQGQWAQQPGQPQQGQWAQQPGQPQQGQWGPPGAQGGYGPPQGQGNY